MTWGTVHRRGDVLQAVTRAADERRDGILPMDVTGVRETFGDELTLLAALQLRWHTRLSGRIERELMNQPMDLERAVIAAWQGTAEELPGIRAIIDHHRAEPLDDAMATAMVKSAAKEHILLAVMAGRVSAHDATAARIGEAIEASARSSFRPVRRRADTATPTLLGKIRAALAA